MASQTTICNRALETIGVARIDSITDGSGPANALKRVWDDTLRAFLADHPWNFARMRAQIAASAVIPAFGWDFYYPVPADFIRLLAVKNEPTFSLEAMPDGSQAIACSAASPLYISYIYNLTDVSRLPPHAVEALARWLANDVVYDQSNASAAMVQRAQGELQKALANAKRVNGMQRQGQPMPLGSWNDSRWQFSNQFPILTTDGQ